MFDLSRSLSTMSVLASALLLAAAPGLAERRSGVELGVTAGLVFPDENLVGVDNPGVEPAVGAWLGGDLVGRFGWFADAQYAAVGTETFAGEAAVSWGRVGAEFRAGPPKKYEPFYAAGVGYMLMTFDNATDFTSAFVSVGIGQHIAVARSTRLRWEVRLDHTLAEQGLRGEDVTQIQGLIGINWGIGRGRGDADGDAVSNHLDRCPATPAGASVDRRGCPRDSDGDGVYDGLDRCAGSPRGADLDETGCPRDADRDGVADSADACPQSPPGVVVDRLGCAPDHDKDGVPDAIDACPGTVRGIEIDERGCFLDRDRDGVYDGLGQDKCPDTPPGAKVDVHGCPLDRDGDGVYDGLDRCPDTPAGVEVDDDGCPVEE